MVSQVQFYHLTATPMERAVPKLLEKALEAEYRVLLVAGSDEQADLLNQVLWTYSSGAFLPHGSHTDPFPERQPVFISTRLESPNQANLLFVTEGSVPENMAAYDRVVDLFDGASEEQVERARARWKQYKDQNIPVSYFSQNAAGGWEKKAG